MVSGSRTAQSIESATGSLHEDLARLRVQKQALERELAAVVAHLDSVQRALGALEILMVSPEAEASTPTAEAAAAAAAAEKEPSVTATDSEVDSGSAESSGITLPQPFKPHSAKKVTPSVASGTDIDKQRKYGKITEQIMDYFAGVGDVDVRARDVAAALGRDTDNGSINGVRSTLDRLVGTSRIQRTGRGLYRAVRS
ncbi:hypothetical protein ABZ357_10300 [Streptomyces sp. NPDC005917]|uniref:hypothetical protein n=1 Tax=unclassified Streptomyces TaxID=2593676 RepID=UPI0034077E3E